MKKIDLRKLCFATILVVCTSCGGGGGGSSANSPTGNEQNSDPGGQGNTNDVDKCQEILKLYVNENGIERGAYPSEIAKQGYEIAKKCDFDQEELSLYLKKHGYE